ncbi:hypothetical protein EZV61_10325 [Corallincola luteus]|uniref:PLAT domain-containing protein n=1 Tax=Corallincola luteus TaxID=1775177 RepID=A0ABY2AK86_9GAMM|nr:hypothetical protein [Corallincola luteus]TCI03267.1 hypothetical protein EZV61_10325 [Corallincola luteus]
MSVPITKVMLIVSTATEANADSDMFVELHIAGLSGAELPLAGTQGASKIFEIPTSGDLNLDQVSPTDIELSVDGDAPSSFNAWLPGSCYVLGKGDSTDYQLLCAIPEWPSSIWFCADSSAHEDPPAFNGVVTLQMVLDAM